MEKDDASVEDSLVEIEGTQSGDVDSERVPAEPQSLENKKRKRFSKKKLQLIKDEYSKRGVVYVGRIPPKMKQNVLRRMLSEYGEIGRLYLQTEDPAVWRKRKQRGGYKGRYFEEGWVEFLDKRIAKRVAQSLNGQPMGGKHRSPFRHELWCMKYLPKFKWEHLLEGIEFQKNIYRQKLQTELAEAKKDQEFYLSKVNQAKKEEHLQKLFAEGGQNDVGGNDKDDNDNDNDNDSNKKKIRRMFEQNVPNADPDSDSELEIADDLAMLVGGKKYD